MEEDRPGSFDELQAELHSGDHMQIEFHSAYALARTFGALGECFCGADIIHVGAFAEAVADSYGLSQAEAEEFEAEILDSGLEVGDFDNSSVCAYHGEQLRKPD